MKYSQESKQLNKRLFSVKEASEYLGISIHFLYKLSAQSKIPHVKIGKRLLFDIKRLEELIIQQSVEPVDWPEHIKICGGKNGHL